MFRKLFCKHDMKFVKAHEHSQQNLWKCNKCGLFYIQHYGLGIGYKTRNTLTGILQRRSRQDKRSTNAIQKKTRRIP